MICNRSGKAQKRQPLSSLTGLNRGGKMETTNTRADLKPLETRTISVGLILAGLAIAIIGKCFLMKSTTTTFGGS